MLKKLPNIKCTQELMKISGDCMRDVFGLSCKLGCCLASSTGRCSERVSLSNDWRGLISWFIV